MQRLIIFILIFVFVGCESNSEITAGTTPEKKDFTVNGYVKGILGERVFLTGFYGHKTHLIDSADVDRSGHFIFNVDKDITPGLYRIMLGQNLRSQFMGGGEQFVDLIFNYDDISFETHFEFPFDSMNVQQSNENKLYYEYLLKTEAFKTKLELLQQTISYYPKEDDFINVLIKQHQKEAKAYDKYIEKLIKNNKGSLLAKIAAFEKIPTPDPKLTTDQRNELIKKDFFNPDDFKDTVMLYTDLIPTKVIRYLSLYRQERFTQEVQEAEFIKAVNLIMAQVGTNEQIYNNVLDYLIDGFERFGMETVLLHIYDNFILGNSCFDDEKTASIREKTEAIKRMAKGQTAPDFVITDLNNNTLHLNDITAEFTLVVFWASWCPHCTTVLPEIKTLYDNTDRSRFEVVAISLDRERDEWLNYVNTNNLNWINFSNVSGWDCPIAKSYYVFATPSLFLLDKDKKILAKPLNIRDLSSYL
ncbi:MAG: TlpA disulfide reductase family protein [Bacteroidales bacterium]|nr:TlpA disulfide reductase family protein [Bacteroidales bacterium]